MTINGLIRKAAPPAVLLAAIVVVWHVAAVAFEIQSLLLPKPARVLSAAYNEFANIAGATWTTATAAVCAFALSLIAGVLIGFAFSQSRVIRTSCYPYAIFLQTVPIIAIAPLIITWFGYGSQSVVIVAFIISLFPIITNATTGMLSVDPDLLDLFRLNDATRLQVLWKLRLPNSVPYIITGAKTSSGLAVIGAIVGEFFAGTNRSLGLGYLIRLKSEQMKTDGLFASVFASTLLGVIIFGSVSLVGSAILHRWYDQPADGNSP